MKTKQPDWSETFRQELRFTVEKNHLTQKKLSRLSGIHLVSVNRILNGKMRPTLDTIHKLSRAAGIDVGKLFDGGFQPARKGGSRQ